MGYTRQEVMGWLQLLANPQSVAGMARFGINPYRALGISIYELRKLAKRIGVDHRLALELWEGGVHEGCILASYIEDPNSVSERQAEAWVSAFDSWDVCDQVCGLFEQTEFAYRKVTEWGWREEEFVKRAAFAILAGLAVHDRAAPDAQFARFFPLIEAQAWDERNFVKKAVNWALRNIGKRNRSLHAAAVDCARRIASQGSRSARWIAADALRELNSEKAQARLEKQG
jgi:3-methyladenine DNA glycosylase AlkD